MTIRVALRHVTRYDYPRPIRLGPQVVRLRPAPHCRTRIVGYSLTIEPSVHFLNWQQDPQSNWLARILIPEPAAVFQVEVDLVADLSVINPFDFFLEPSAEMWPFSYDAALARELRPYLEVETAGPLLARYLAELPREPGRSVDRLVALNQRLREQIGYVIRLEHGIQTTEETLAKRTGSCRDSAWLLVQVLRHLGLAARFVSGYLIQLVPDVRPLVAPGGPGAPGGPDADFTDLHAWVEVYLPGAGWVGLDPTSGLLAGEGHIPLACTADPGLAAPVSGVLEPCESRLHHEMTVTRIDEEPRVTKPYSEEAWERIVTAGHAVDERIARAGIRLTVGGEPTFVSIDDMEGPEWTVDALGDHKLALAHDLLDRLRRSMAPGAVSWYGQGKWYPGEPLPRWAIGLFWRADGVPIWRSRTATPSRILEEGPGAIVQARRLVDAIAHHLGVAACHALVAYEDPIPLLLAEASLPINVEANDPRLADPRERDRMVRSFAQGLGASKAVVLPIQAFGDGDKRAWRSGPWFLRRPAIDPGDAARTGLFLVPGDSPAGLRLPLASLPWIDPQDDDRCTDPDPSIARDVLDSESTAPRSGEELEVDSRRPCVDESARWTVRTALCIEPREESLGIFLPPCETLEDWLQLVGAVELALTETGLPGRIEGYEPPQDPRLRRLTLTPDPGVLEVNVPPCEHWDGLVEQTTLLYDEARRARLGTEKFLVDGRHAGTGGGNHVVLGGPTPDESPFLRRPDLLRSLLAYWNNHPSLSYLFSGLFIGPTSQAPRIDEARDDLVYELEIAFGAVPDRGEEPVAPWLVDRIFRHLLVDVTGNTHRTEFCIDKLWSPDTAGGRRGLVELRAFEMPPHARMSLVQQLLIRSLIAWFWEVPFRTPLVRWGTRLHNDFMLPHHVAADIAEVARDLEAAGFRCEEDWFAPFLAFRFPILGAITVDDATIELRSALEPWHVLGEEPLGGAQTRYVDSSVERLQVLATGLDPRRHAVACNGAEVPLRPTGRAGEQVAGVRYRAWQPPNALHPTLPVDAPLIFDIVDRAAARAIAGCTYHVAHPGGRNYEAFPVNALEAEARRLARFHPMGHTPGRRVPIRREPAPEFPGLLDLRRHGGSRRRRRKRAR